MQYHQHELSKHSTYTIQTKWNQDERETISIGYILRMASIICIGVVLYDDGIGPF